MLYSLYSCFVPSGSYSESIGLEIIRNDVAEYIKRRDGGLESNPKNIMLSAGASEAIRVSIPMGIIDNEEDLMFTWALRSDN